MRDQFNSLKDLVDALTVRVVALEPHPLIAAGFGDPGANGPLTQDGISGGLPTYLTPSGARYYLDGMRYVVDLNGGFFGGHYVADADMTVTGSYQPFAGAAPGGTVA